MFIVYKLKDLILTGGFNVYPVEMERVLAGRPTVTMVAIGRKSDSMKGEIAKSYIVQTNKARSTVDGINAFYRENLVAYKCPGEIEFVEDLPKMSSAKVLSMELHTLDNS